MERCPKCGKYFLSYNLVDLEKVCLNKDCNYREKITKEEYFGVNNILPKLARCLNLR
jgi:hypothetical protein